MCNKLEKKPNNFYGIDHTVTFLFYCELDKTVIKLRTCPESMRSKLIVPVRTKRNFTG